MAQPCIAQTVDTSWAANNADHDLSLSNAMNSRHIRPEALRYQRPYRFTVDALHTLCCAPGRLKERLQRVDPEFFSLNLSELPQVEPLRSKFVELHALVTSKDPRYPYEGRISATIDQMHHTKLKAVAELIWALHVEFLAFMQHDESTSS